MSEIDVSKERKMKDDVSVMDAIRVEKWTFFVILFGTQLREADSERRKAQLIEFGMVNLSSTGRLSRGFKEGHPRTKRLV